MSMNEEYIYDMLERILFVLSEIRERLPEPPKE